MAAATALHKVEQQASELQRDHHVQLASLIRTIHEKDLYRAKGFSSLGAYVAAHRSLYCISKSQAYRLLSAAQIYRLAGKTPGAASQRKAGNASSFLSYCSLLVPVGGCAHVHTSSSSSAYALPSPCLRVCLPALCQQGYRVRRGKQLMYTALKLAWYFSREQC